MNVSSVKIVSFLVVLGALVVCTLPVAAQNMSRDFDTPDRTAQINTSLGFAVTGGIRQDNAQGRMLTAHNPDNQTFTGKPHNLDLYVLREIAGSETEPLTNVNATAQNESAILSQTSPTPQRFESGLYHHVHFPLLKKSTIGNLLVDLKKKYDPKSMTESGNLYWFFDSQHDLTTGSKSKQLLACTRMLRSWGVCASTNARTFSVYIRDL
jgi:hypothetical protein